MIPKLRFPGFSGEWEIMKLASFSDFQEGPGIMAIDFRTDGVPLIRLSGLTGRFVTLDGCNYLDPDKVMQKWNHFRLEKGDLLLSSSASLGVVSEVGDDTKGAVAYTGIIRFRPVANKSTKNFLKQVLISNAFMNQVANMSTGATIHHFGPTHIKQMSFTVPKEAEQEKIAGFLMVVDERIAAADKKVELLQQYKKGIMQKIFTKKLRFKDEKGADYPGWETKKLSDVARFVNGYTFLSSTYNEAGKYKVVTIANVQAGRLDITKANKVSSLPLNIQHKQILDRGDMLISMTGNVGRVCLVDEDDCLLNQRVGKIVPQSADGAYLFHLLNRDAFVERMISQGQGGAQDNVSSKDIMNYKLQLPINREQKKIASFLTSLDDKINLERAKLERAKLFKKSLLQRMLV